MSNAIHTTRFLRVAGSLGLVAVMAGCASSTPVLDATFGDAVRAARVAQTLNPDASANRNPVTGIDGGSGARAIYRYENTKPIDGSKPLEMPPLPSMGTEGGMSAN